MLKPQIFLSFFFFGVCKNWGEFIFGLFYSYINTAVVFHSEPLPDPMWTFQGDKLRLRLKVSRSCYDAVHTPCTRFLLLPCRMDCYKQVTTMLDRLYEHRTSSSYSPSVTVGSSIPASQDVAHLSQSEANDQVICCFFCHPSGVFLRQFVSRIMPENLRGSGDL